MNRGKAVLGLMLAASSWSPALATETIAYSYDALGRLVAVVHSGSVNNGLQSTYQFDKADNRTNVTVTGAAH